MNKNVEIGMRLSVSEMKQYRTHKKTPRSSLSLATGNSWMGGVRFSFPSGDDGTSWQPFISQYLHCAIADLMCKCSHAISSRSRARPRPRNCPSHTARSKRDATVMVIPLAQWWLAAGSTASFSAHCDPLFVSRWYYVVQQEPVIKGLNIGNVI